MNQPNESTADDPEPVVLSRRSARKSRNARRAVVSAVAPLVVAAAVFGVAYAIRSGAEARYGHEVTLATRHDGRTGAWDHRNELAEVLQVEAERSADDEPNVDVSIATRFNNLIDIEVTADDAATAARRADELTALAVDDRTAAATELVRTDIEALTVSLETANDDVARAEAELESLGSEDDPNEAQRNVNSKIDFRNSIERQLAQAQAELASAIVPVRVLDEAATGQTGPEPTRDAALAAAAAAFVVLAAIAAWRPE